MSQPLVSIIVPCYNVENYVRQCIESLIHQSYSNVEIILVDDGSTDKTPSICDEYAKKDSRVKTIHKTNGGLVSARNSGYQAVTGDWMMYVDGDDWMDLNACEELLDIISDNPDCDIMFWRCVMELGSHTIYDKWGCISQDAFHTYTNDECIELARNTLVYTSGIATAYDKLIRTEYAHKFNICHDDKLRQGAEGLEFSLRAFYHAKKAIFINKFYYHYRYVAGSITKKVNEKNTKYLTECLNAIQEDIQSFKRKGEFQQQLYQRTVYALISVAMSTFFNKANKESYSVRSRKFSNVIKENKLYQDSIRLCSTEGMDKKRIITLFFIRMKMYYMLDIIERCKEFMIKRGKFNY